MKITAIKTAIFSTGEDLPGFILRHVPAVSEGTVLAVASKLLALWRGKAVAYKDLSQKEDLIKRESSWALKTPLAWLTVKNGMVMTNAGIDESNADGKLLLLPDCYAAAEELRQRVKQVWGVKNLGIVVTDSMILPLRAGVIAGAVAYSGFKGVRDLRGQKDLFGRPLQVTLVNVADSLATAAAYCMGEGAEGCPLAVVDESGVTFVDEVDPNEIKYSIEDDLYTPLFHAAGYITKGEQHD